MATSQDAAAGPFRATRWIFGAAGAYGVITLVPMFFLEPAIAAHNPPALTHPEFFYGFLGLALAFQLLFALIAWRPTRLWPAIPAAVAEKYGYVAVIGFLMAWHRSNDLGTAAFALIDAVLGTLFLLSYFIIRRSQPLEGTSELGDLAPAATTGTRFLVVTQRTSNFDPLVLKPHFAFLASLRKKGLLVDAGGFGDQTGGAYVLRASSMAQAESVAYLDPLHTWGASKLTVREWKSTHVDI